MKLKKRSYPPLLLTAGIVVVVTGFTFLSQKHHEEIPLSIERELKVTLNAGLGDIDIARNTTGMLFEADVESDRDRDFSDAIDYTIRDGMGYLNIDINDNVERHDNKKNFSFHGFDLEHWSTRFSNTIPISFDLELGLGTGNLDFTGLKVKDLNISAGASSVTMRFDEPNSAVIDYLHIESGLSKFRAEGLGNANFNHLKFEGGVGSYVLDFSGALKKEVDVDIEVGLGALTIIIPEKIGAHVTYEKNWSFYCSMDDDFKEESEHNFFTQNYHTAAGKLNLRIESGLGSVIIRRE